MSLEGKVAIITGSSSGIGESTALLFAEGKTKLVLAARNEENLNRVASACRERGLPRDHVLVIKCDVTKKDNLQHLVDKTIKTFGRLDILVNNAGDITGSSIMNSREEDLDLMLDVNLKAVYNLSKLCVPHLIKTKGSIINVSALYSTRPGMPAPLYSVAKAALDMFTRALALELAPNGVRVNSVNPGAILTPKFTSFQNLPNETVKTKMEERLLALQPLGGIGKPEYVAKAIRFLASSDSEFVTGHHLMVDSGLHCRLAT